MEPILIRGVPVRFPFEPYDIQRTYMEKVIACLQDGVNGILESPTGTGKTLCLLCAALAWSESVKAELAASVHDLSHNQSEFFAALNTQLRQAAGAGWRGGGASALASAVSAPRIVFASRTHSQLTQVVHELKRTDYRHVRSVVLGSRDQLCIHAEVSREANNTTKLHMCQARVKARTCMPYNHVESRRNDKQLVESTVMDIEDLVGVGRKLNFCPYYMARALREAADIVFMPYNYLLDPKTRKANGIDLHNSVVILDEAHNIEKTCEDSASLQFRSTDLALCVEELTHVLTQMVSPEASGDLALADSQSETGVSTAAAELNADNIMLLKAMLLELEKAIDAIAIADPVNGVNFPGSFMFELLEKAQIVYSKRAIIVEELDRVISYLTNSATSVFSRRGNGLQKFADLIKVVFSREQFSVAHMERVKRCYKVHLGVDTTRAQKRTRTDLWPLAADGKLPQCRVLSYWCFSSGFGMCDLMEQGVKSVILTSGTLSPLDAFISELHIALPVRLENPHIISADQVCVACVPRGPDGVHLSSSYANRSNASYINSLGQTVANVSRLVPDGLLVFFPSYGLLKSCSDAWQLSGVWGRIASSKTIFTEAGTKEEFSQSIQDYYRHIEAPVDGTRGACFLAVCRGKVSEGLDFANRNGRAVIITGLPYPPLKDPRVVLKRQYLDESRRLAATTGAAVPTPGLSGQEWYSLEASRAINQAIGRVIRHGRDYGAILLCDSRLADAHFSRQLSAWLRPHIKSYAKFGLLVRDLTAFFRCCAEKYPCAADGNRSRQSATAGQARYASFPLHMSRHVSGVGCGAGAAAADTLSAQVNISSVYKVAGGVAQQQATQQATLFEQDAHWHDNFSLHSAATGDGSGGGGDGGASSNDARDLCNKPPASCHTAVTIASCTAPTKPSSSKFKLRHNPAACVLGGAGRSTSTLFTLAADSVESSAVVATQSKSAAPDAKASQKRVVAEYILKAKRLLTAHDYCVFSQAIKAYNRDHNFDRMLALLSSVLVGDDRAQHYQLLTGFSCFVRAEHRCQFSQYCSSVSNRE